LARDGAGARVGQVELNELVRLLKPDDGASAARTQPGTLRQRQSAGAFRLHLQRGELVVGRSRKHEAAVFGGDGVIGLGKVAGRGGDHRRAIDEADLAGRAVCEKEAGGFLRGGRWPVLAARKDPDGERKP
jgi:hypothetical protein